ncbi:hypothetical protein AB0C52_14440 [Streptomyces sp. NPDC048717]|uniref:hypothetical protein n=1 Tax=Streptomyces sp. NPDC048717 TaxID=3154928 RepID=UPI003416B6A5
MSGPGRPQVPGAEPPARGPRSGGPEEYEEHEPGAAPLKRERRGAEPGDDAHDRRPGPRGLDESREPDERSDRRDRRERHERYERDERYEQHDRREQYESHERYGQHEQDEYGRRRERRERNRRDEQNEQGRRYGNAPHDDRDDVSGHAMVNEAPEGPEGGLPDELALRRLLQGAVSGLEPAPGVLDHLRQAVPARRARKRQAVVGLAAAIVLVGTAVPALVHVASSGGVVSDQAVNAGHGEQAQGGTGSETGVEGGEQQPAGPGTGASASPGGGSEGSGETDTPDSGTAGGEDASATPSGAPAGVAGCQAAQLGVTSARTEAPDAAGKVYGSFRIANISGRECVVEGAGTVGFQARGAADQKKIAVVEHISGDAAAGLPDPSMESTKLLLPPDNAYEVRFAWVPSDACVPSGGGVPATPLPDPSSDGGEGTGGDAGGAGGTSGSAPADSGSAPQLGVADGASAEGSVAVSHTAEPGGPVAETTIPNACAGTIYRTGVLGAS